ncbi:MAG: methionyl-tRNA formyltransferase [Parcubacteria group bacterium]|nr:methionyl-tRNA formyltransferase [Parcubacteria group bacterium]
MASQSNIAFAFFGTDEFSVIILEVLKSAGMLPALVVTAPDRPKGRGLKLTPPPVKVWAQKNGIPLLQPEKLDGHFYSLLTAHYSLDLFVVASYGKILPKEIINIPKHGALNVHPSLLPLYRGASPIQAQILEGTPETGVTIMVMDEKMDHGPVAAQRLLGGVSLHKVQNLPDAEKLKGLLAHLGGTLLAEVMPGWLAGTINPKEQDDTHATYTKKISKEDGLIKLEDDAEKNFRRFKAFIDWPGAYFFAQRNGESVRVKITDAALEDGAFVVKRIIPEGKKEMSYDDFLRQV